MSRISITSSSIVIDCEADTLDLEVNLTPLKEINIYMGNENWSMSCIKDFDGDLRFKTPNLEKLILIDFTDWDITALPATLKSLTLTCNDNSLDLRALNLKDLTHIEYFSFCRGEIFYTGTTHDELLHVVESYHTDTFEREDITSGYGYNNEIDDSVLAPHSSFFKYKVEKKEAYAKGTTIGAMSDGIPSNKLGPDISTKISEYLVSKDGGRIAQTSINASTKAKQEVDTFVFKSSSSLFSSDKLNEDNLDSPDSDNQTPNKKPKI